MQGYISCQVEIPNTRDIAILFRSLSREEESMARSKKAQSKHDAEVRRIAREFEKKGFDVQADVSGFSKPDTLGGFRPDVVAKKGKQQKIVEVETKDSVDSVRDRAQQQAFRKAAERSDKTTFRRTIADKD